MFHVFGFFSVQSKLARKGSTVVSAERFSFRDHRESEKTGKSDSAVRKRSTSRSGVEEERVKSNIDSSNRNTRGKLKTYGSKNDSNKDRDQGQRDSSTEDEETVMIIPRFGPASKETENSSQGADEKDTSPQVVLSPTSKYITGKSGGKSQVFKLSLAPGSEGQLLQAGDTVKLGSTLLKITPKSGSRNEADKKGECSQQEQEEEREQEEYISSLDTSIDEFEILEESMEDEEDEDVSYPSVQQDAFFSAFGLVKKTELPKDGKVNKLHRLAGGKLRRVLKPNFAPGMVYKDGKIVVEDAAEGSPKSKAKALKSQFAQKLDFDDAADIGSGNSPKPKKREWLKPPPRKSKSPVKDQAVIETAHSKSSRNASKGKALKQQSEKKLKKHSSFPGEGSSKRPSSMSKTKSSDDIDLNMLPFRRSSRQRDSKRKEWKHLLRAAPDEFEEDPKWEEEIDKRRHRSQARMAKKLEREKHNEEQQKEQPGGDTSEEEVEDTRKKEKVSKPTPVSKAKKSHRKDVEKQIKEADSSKKYADIYDEIILKRGSFNKIRKQADWGLAKKMLDEEQKKAKQRRLAAVKLMDNVDKGKSVVITKGMGVYEGISWEMSHIEEKQSPVKSRSTATVETVTEEIISPDGEVIKIKVEKDVEKDDDSNESSKNQKKKKKRVKDKEEKSKESTDVGEKGSKKILLSPKFAKMPAPPIPVKREEPVTSTNVPSRSTPMIVILGPDGKPLPPARSSYLCEKIRSTLEEVVQKPEMLRKGRVLELKVPIHKKLPPVYRHSRDKNEMDQEETSPSHQSFLPIVSVKTDFQRELECQVPHMCSICWVNDHMYCKNMKRLERDLPYTGGCMHSVPCRHYMHLDEHILVNKARFLSVRKWQETLAAKYFENDRVDFPDKYEDFDGYDREDLALIEDEDGNFIAVNAEGVKLTDEDQIRFVSETKTVESGVKELAVTATEEGRTSPLPLISSSQDSGYHSELTDSQQTSTADTSMESAETDEVPEINADEENRVVDDTEKAEVNKQEQTFVPAGEITSPKKLVIEESAGEEEWDALMCNETFGDSDAENELDITPPAGTEILNIQIRARASQISRSLVFDDKTIDSAKSLCVQEEMEEEKEVEAIDVEDYGAEMILGDSGISDDERLVAALLYPDKCPTHYEFVHEDTAGQNEIEETSEFIDIRGRRHRVIKVHIAKLDEETRGELMKSLSTDSGRKSSVGSYPSHTQEFYAGRKRKRTGSTDSNESDESESKKKLSPGSKKGLMQKTDVHQFSLKTHKAMRGPLSSSSSITAKTLSKTGAKEGDEQVRFSLIVIKKQMTKKGILKKAGGELRTPLEERGVGSPSGMGGDGGFAK